MKKNLRFLLFIVPLFFLQPVLAQSAGDYKSVASGKWSDITIWQTFNGVNWINAIVPPSNINGVITITASDSIAVTDTVYADQVVIQAGAKLNVINTFNLMNGAGTDLIANGNLLVQISSTLGSDTLIGGSTIEYKAAEFYIDGALKPDITFDGAVAQTIDGSGYLSLVNINNPNNVTATGTPALTGVNFTAGKIIAPNFILYGEFSSGFTGQGPTSFIDGNVLCIMYDTRPNIVFDLPIGKNGHYSPLVLTATQDDGQETELLVAIKDSAAPVFTLPASLDKVSAVRYVNISRNNTTDNLTASLQLSYDSTDGVSDPASLRIAESDTTGGANTWVNLGGTGSAAKNGIITTTVNFSTFTNFALANATGGSNTLPLHFISFTAAVYKQAVVLNWATANEVNTNYFNVERSDAANNWKTVGSVNANKNSTAKSYAFTDATVSSTGSYVYRIKEIDKDGSFYFSSEVLVHMVGNGKMEVTSLYPNPTQDMVNYYISAGGNNNVTVAITGADGKLLSVQHATTNQALQVGIHNLASGTYFLTFTNESTGEKVVKKVVKM